MASKQHIRKNIPAQPVHQTLPVAKPKSIWVVLAKAVIFAILVCGAIVYTDWKGWFNPDDTNNHTQRKWDAYYQFTKNNEVDIVMVGNSHLYAGINPKNLSCALGVNCFILAAPGTSITDAYYCLKEAIAVCKPKIAVIETYAIENYQTHGFTDSRLSDQFQSFHARKNLSQKLLSTPELFTSSHYLPAWSNTIRNHSYIFTDQQQIKKNVQAKNSKMDNKLYLGRFVSFPTGMTDSTLQKYDIHGAASIVDGNNFSVGEEARQYVRKIVDLCRENNVEPVFLTIPMYHRHIKNYDVWEARLVEELAPYNSAWLNLQSPYDYDAFVPLCFENSVRSNQHLSYQGSLISSYKLAHFIHEKFPEKLPNRSKDTKWNDLFYGEEGYYENYSLKPNDTTANVLFTNIVLPNLAIKEIDLFSKKEYDLILIKVDNQNVPELRGKRLQLLVDAKLEGQQIVANVEAETSPLYDPLNHYLFVTTIRKGVTILGIRSAAITDMAAGH